MKDNGQHITDWIPEYLDGLLEDDQRKKMEDHIKACSSCAEELVKMEKLLQAFDREPIATPSSQIETNFLKQLEEEKKTISKEVFVDLRSKSKEDGAQLQFFRIAAGIALLIGAFLLGKYQTKIEVDQRVAALTAEKTKMKQAAMLALMENQSASKRIQGVGYIEEFTSPDQAILTALIQRMQGDDNANVRLTALEALSKFSTTEMVKEGFIQALSTEKNPSIQIALIQVLVKIQEKKAAGPLKNLLEQEDTQPFIKDEIKQVLPEII